MGFLDRMSTVVQAKMNKIMDKIEDPRETWTCPTRSSSSSCRT